MYVVGRQGHERGCQRRMVVDVGLQHQPRRDGDDNEDGEKGSRTSGGQGSRSEEKLFIYWHAEEKDESRGRAILFPLSCRENNAAETGAVAMGAEVEEV